MACSVWSSISRRIGKKGVSGNRHFSFPAYAFPTTIHSCTLRTPSAESLRPS
jgi:hypothetical protein